MTSGLHEDEHDPGDGGQESDVHVDLESEEVELRRVESQGLQECPARAVPEQVEAQCLAPAEGEPTLEHKNDEHDADRVPDHLVEEQGLKEGTGR